MNIEDDPFDIASLRLPPGQVEVSRTPPKIAKRREHFIKVPFGWLERLKGAGGKVYALALHLLYLHWKAKEAPIKLANGMLKIDGIDRYAKWRALRELERRGLISIQRRSRKSPVITLQLAGNHAAGLQHVSVSDLQHDFPKLAADF